MGGWRAVFLAAAVTIAGCSAVSPPMADTARPPPTGAETPTDTATPAHAPTPTPEQLVVDASDLDRRTATRVVGMAISYWERFVDTRVVLRPNASDADVRVVLTDRANPWSDDRLRVYVATQGRERSLRLRAIVGALP